MMNKTMLVGAATVVALGSGGVAWAATGSDHTALNAPTAVTSAAATAGTSTATPAAGKTNGAKAGKTGNARKGAKARKARLGNALHGTWVTKAGKKASAAGTAGYVTHDAIRGTASAVSATSITVTAADKVAETYTISSRTRVRAIDATTHKPTTTTASAVKNGQRVVVMGTGTSKLTATRIVIGKK